MRLAEAAGMAKEDVFLDKKMRYVRLCEHPWRPLKTKSSQRDVPLVGAALRAAQRAYESSPNDYFFLVTVQNRDVRQTMRATR